MLLVRMVLLMLLLVLVMHDCRCVVEVRVERAGGGQG